MGNKLLCFLGLHKYIDDERDILQIVDGRPAKAKLPVTWCKHCHECKDMNKEIIRTMLVS